MKRLITFCSCLVAMVVLFTTCKPEKTSDYIVSWNIETPNAEDNSTYYSEITTIYQAFDNAFSSASFGTVSNHQIIAKSCTEKDILKIKNEVLQLAIEANSYLATSMFCPKSTHNVSIQGFDLNNYETLVSYTYNPCGGGDDNGDDNGDGGDDNQGYNIGKPVFYAPLTSDLEDLVGGLQGTLYGPTQNFSAEGMYFNGNRVVFTDGWWTHITYDTPFTLILDYTKTENVTSEHLTLLCTFPAAYGSNERGIRFYDHNGNLDILRTGIIKDANSTYSMTIPYNNSSIINTHHIKTGIIYDGNGTVTRIQDGVITTATYSISQADFPNFADLPLNLGGYNYGRDTWIGYISNVALFDRALSQAELDALHQ